MANIPLKTIKFPGLDDTYTVPQVDDTLSVTGAAADAKKTGDELTELNERLDDIKSDLEQAPGLTQEAREALLACFEHVVWADEHGQDYYAALEEALYDEPIPANPFENANYEIGGWGIAVNEGIDSVTDRNVLENRAGSALPIPCSSGKLIAKTGYNINAHLLTGLTYGSWTNLTYGTQKDGYLDGLYTNTTHYQWDTEKTIPSGARYVCVSVKKTDNTNFSASEVAALYGTAFEYVKASV